MFFLYSACTLILCMSVLFGEAFFLEARRGRSRRGRVGYSLMSRGFLEKGGGRGLLLAIWPGYIISPSGPDTQPRRVSVAPRQSEATQGGTAVSVAPRQS
jgi:hypothetical protein